MSWSLLEVARYEAHILWGKLKVPRIRNRCHLCAGKGITWEADGWGPPYWHECYLCKGSGAKI